MKKRKGRRVSFLKKSEEAFNAAKVKINHYPFIFFPSLIMGFDCFVNLRSLVSYFDFLRSQVCAVLNIVRVLVKLLKLVYFWFEFDLREQIVDFVEL